MIYGSDLDSLQRNILSSQALQNSESNNAMNRLQQTAQFQQGVRERAKVFDWQTRIADQELARKDAQLQMQREELAQRHAQNMQNFKFANDQLEAQKQHWQEQMGLQREGNQLANDQYQQNRTDQFWRDMRNEELQTLKLNRENPNIPIHQQEFLFNDLGRQADQGLLPENEQDIAKLVPGMDPTMVSSLVRRNQEGRRAKQDAFDWAMDAAQTLNKQDTLKKQAENNTYFSGVPFVRSMDRNVAARAATAELPILRSKVEKIQGDKRFNDLVVYDPATGQYRPTRSLPWQATPPQLPPPGQPGQPVQFISSPEALGASPSNTVRLPPPGQFVGQPATNRVTGQVLIWNGQSWVPAQ